MKFQSFIHIGMAAGAAFLTGCAADAPDEIAGSTPADIAAGDSRIEIFAGTPASIGGTTRAVEEPSRPGVCDADRCKLWFYRGTKGTSLLASQSFGAGDVTPIYSQIVRAERFGDLYAQNKLASYLYDFEAVRGVGFTRYYTAMAVPALGYTEKDGEKFVTDTISYGNKLNQLTLSLTGSDTPELYFGRLTFPVYEDTEKKDDSMKASDDGVFYYQAGPGGNQKFPECPVNGRLYRIVSQMNITLTDVPEGEIEKLELYVSDFPDRMTLFGNHGAFYHVATASHHSGSENEYVSVATCDHFHKGEARLSTFLLPSDLGYRMKIRVYYPEGKVFDSEGNPVRYKDCDIRPAKSVVMQGNDAEVYFDGAAEHLKQGRNLFVYNDSEQRFYSYSNVRINLSGDFDNVLREVTPVDIRVEVCPAFQNDHYFDIE